MRVMTKSGEMMPLEEVTASTYKCPIGEEHCVHVKQTTLRSTGNGFTERESMLQIYGFKEWQALEHQLRMTQGYEIEVLYKPYSVSMQQPKVAQPHVEVISKEEAKAETAKKTRSRKGVK